MGLAPIPGRHRYVVLVTVLATGILDAVWRMVLALGNVRQALKTIGIVSQQATLLNRSVRDKTVIALAHRLSTIAEMDGIVVLKAGRISEVGNHAEQLRAGGRYAAFWAHQSGGFLTMAEATAM